MRTATALENELGQLMAHDPRARRRAVEDLVLKMHSGATVAVGLARGAGVNYEEIGRGLAMLEDAGLIQRATTLLRALPAANHAIETACRHQATLEGLSQPPSQQAEFDEHREHPAAILRA